MIQERAMLAAVHISIWTAVKHDRGVSRDVAERNGAPMSAGRYNKQLLRGADKLDELRTLAGQVRQYFYKITLPWTDEGYRLLPANLYFDLTARMREFEAQFEQGVEAFLTVYPQYIEQVRPELNGLFREEDYPKAEKLRRKFGVKLEVLPIPTGNDFRVQMSAEEQARVAREIDSNVRQSLVRGTEDLWSRLRDVVSHMVDRLNEPESRFHATLVTNIFDLVELLPQLNVTGDPELNRFAEEARQKLCTYTAHDLKKHELLRVVTATDAAGIVSRMDEAIRNREAEQAETEARLGPGHLRPYVGVHGGARGGMRHETPAAERIRKARTALLLDHPFFGSLLFRLKSEEDRAIPTMATDGVVLRYNPEFVDTLNSATLAGVLAHEVMHPALQHHIRRSKRDPRRWNEACDYRHQPTAARCRPQSAGRCACRSTLLAA